VKPALKPHGYLSQEEWRVWLSALEKAASLLFQSVNCIHSPEA